LVSLRLKPDESCRGVSARLESDESYIESSGSKLIDSPGFKSIDSSGSKLIDSSGFKSIDSSGFKFNAENFSKRLVKPGARGRILELKLQGRFRSYVPSSGRDLLI
jgi:hypothetical protein